MNARERVLIALHHEQPDMTPWAFEFTEHALALLADYYSDQRLVVPGFFPWASEEEVRATIKHIIDVMGSDGGFILSPSHAVQVDTPLENIIAIYQEAGSLTDSLPTTASAVVVQTHYGPVPPESQPGRIGRYDAD